MRNIKNTKWHFHPKGYVVVLFLWITHSQICFRALPPEKTVFLQVPVYSNLRQAFRIRASVKTERGREKQ